MKIFPLFFAYLTFRMSKSVCRIVAEQARGFQFDAGFCDLPQRIAGARKFDPGSAGVSPAFKQKSPYLFCIRSQDVIFDP